MELIICKTFVEQFYTYYQTDNVYWHDFERFLQKYISPNTIIVTDIPESDWFVFGLQYQWFTQLQNRLKKTRVVTDLMTKITEKSYYETCNAFQLFCTDKDISPCKQLAKKFGYLYLNLTHLPDFWQVFYSEREDNFSLKVTKDVQIAENRRLDNWTKLSAFAHPISHILILDKYILSDKTDQKLEHNLFPLLENLLGNLSLQKRICLTFIIEEKDKLVEKQQKVKVFLQEKWQNINFDISLFCYAVDVHVPNFEGLHDRAIYTNYFRIASGDSFNYFKRNKSINNNTEIRFDFVFGKNSSLIMKDLRDIKTYIIKASENTQRYVGNVNNPLLLYIHI